MPQSIRPSDQPLTLPIRIQWQRGSNENLNGLIRQYIPKSRPLSTVTDDELAKIEMLLNNRPRKRLGYKTPIEIFTSQLNCVALRA
jgi:IS30 family transposase